MLSRELELKSAEDGLVRFHLRDGGQCSESEIEGELLPIVFTVDPALDDSTGRLAPGRFASEVTTRLFVVGPDPEGVHHLGGIVCAPLHAAAVAQLAEQRGFRVVGNV